MVQRARLLAFVSCLVTLLPASGSPSDAATPIVLRIYFDGLIGSPTVDRMQKIAEEVLVAAGLSAR